MWFLGIEKGEFKVPLEMMNGGTDVKIRHLIAF
jgi:hypothetical protein